MLVMVIYAILRQFSNYCFSAISSHEFLSGLFFYTFSNYAHSTFFTLTFLPLSLITYCPQLSQFPRTNFKAIWRHNFKIRKHQPSLKAFCFWRPRKSLDVFFLVNTVFNLRQGLRKSNAFCHFSLKPINPSSIRK